MNDRYALFGNPIHHSKSPLIHGTFARETVQGMSYGLIEAPLGGFRAAIVDLGVQGGHCANVTTIPCHPLPWAEAGVSGI